MATSDIEICFPLLASTGYKITSPSSIDYNCIAWAADHSTECWWPDASSLYYWPLESFDDSLESFVKAFETLGYSTCGNGVKKPGFDKIAIYTNRAGKPTHAARQLEDGKWTSKLGPSEDITHEANGLDSQEYGSIAQFMRRRSQRTRH